MSDVAHLAAELFRRASGRERFLVGIAGPPGSGKSMLAERLRELLGAEAAVVAMDGFHLDNALLAARGLAGRKGAPETFDVGGLAALVERLRAPGSEAFAPSFDRAADLARAAAAHVPASARFVIVEGNYLLFDRAPWSGLSGLFDWRVFIDVPRGELARRLVQRWIDHGLDPQAARERAFSNDMANADLVIERRLDADTVIAFRR